LFGKAFRLERQYERVVAGYSDFASKLQVTSIVEKRIRKFEFAAIGKHVTVLG